MNNITLKLITEPKKRAGDWLVEFKNTLSSIQKISAGMVPFEENLDRATTYMNAMIDSLPVVECTFPTNIVNEERIGKSVKAAASELLRGSLRIEDLKSLGLILVGLPNQPDTEEKRLAKKVSIFDPSKKK